MTPSPSRLDDSDYAAFAWRRYRQLMAWMAFAAAASMVASILFLHWLLDEVPWTMTLFTGLGVFCSVFLAAALMGLVFLSSGSGHDESIIDPMEDPE